MKVNSKNDPQEGGVKREEDRQMSRQIEKVEIPPEADSLSIEGWDMDNDRQQAYIRAVNRHLIKTVDTDNKTMDNKTIKAVDMERDEESEDEVKENHGIIGCGVYYPWVTQTDQWIEALQKAEAATGYRASWHWNMERGEIEEIIDWETGERKPKEPEKKTPKAEGWYSKLAKPYQQKVPHILKSGRKSPEREHWETEREQRFQETLKRHQKMFAELLGNK